MTTVPSDLAAATIASQPDGPDTAEAGLGAALPPDGGGAAPPQAAKIVRPASAVPSVIRSVENIVATSTTGSLMIARLPNDDRSVPALN